MYIRKITVSLISHTTFIDYLIYTQTTDNRATDTGKVHRKFVEVWDVVFEIRARTDMQTCIHVDTLVAIHCISIVLRSHVSALPV